MFRLQMCSGVMMLANVKRISCTIRLGRPVTSIVEHVAMFRTPTLVPINLDIQSRYGIYTIVPIRAL